jgi:hypothetical protein
MRFPLTEQLIDEARRFELRSACRDCFYWDARPRVTDPRAPASEPEYEGRCRHDWPDEGQRRWPLDAPDPETGARPTEVAFCKEFELR